MRYVLGLMIACGASWAHGQPIPVPPDTLRHWAAIKGTTEDVLRDRTLWYALARTEADTLRKALAACDSTKRDALGVAANEEERRLNVEQQYRDLDRRTVKKSRLPWYVLAGMVAGFLLAK